jgi:hypothetical protein
MSFWINQNVTPDDLEEKMNELGNLIGVEAPRNLRERFARLRDKPVSLFSELHTGKTCQCSGGNETFSIRRVDSEDFFCLAPAIAFVQGSDKVQRWIAHRVKEYLFRLVPAKRQPKMTEFFVGGNVVETQKEKTNSQPYPDCNLKCTMNEWEVGPCFHLFVRKFKVNLRVHKQGWGGCRWVPGSDETNPTIHLYYQSGYSLIIPSFATIRQLPIRNLLSHEQLEYYRSEPPLSEEQMRFYQTKTPPKNTQDLLTSSQESQTSGGGGITCTAQSQLPVSRELYYSDAENMNLWYGQQPPTLVPRRSTTNQSTDSQDSLQFCLDLSSSPNVPDPPSVLLQVNKSLIKSVIIHLKNNKKKYFSLLKSPSRSLQSSHLDHQHKICR